MLVPLGEVGQDLHHQRVSGRDQQLAPNGVVVLVGVVGPGSGSSADQDVGETVTFALGDIQPPGHHIAGDRAGHAGRQAPGAVIAKGQFRIGSKLERWRLGDDIDDARRGVLAEQCALRPFQDFDPVQLPEIAEGHAATRAVDPVDHRTDR